MKKSLLSLFVALVAMTVGLNAQTIVLDDGFENGIQDSVWTQEFVIGEHPWAVEDKADNPQWPATIWQGSKRAYLRNTSGETEGYVTRLVSKVMDLSPDKVFQPELTFWYANPKWTADRDTLRVLYKTSAKANWKQLAEFSTASATWQKVKLELPEVNETYQIAFEGTDNLGRGIVLDSVKLRSAPECTVPHDIAVYSKGAGIVNIAWNASWDANNYELIVSKELINPDTVNLIPDSLDVIAYHEQIDGLHQNVDVKLTSGEYYYAYLRSICETETSAWNSDDPNQGQFRFRVKATKNVPYHYDIDLPYEAGTIRRDLEWTWGGNTGHFNPFINVNTAAADLGKYSKDATTCIVFTGENNLTSPIPAGKYAYVATPALADTANANFSLNQCQVRFWGTVYQYTGRAYAHSLIVGVMTDAEDITTFQPVDTVSIWGTSTFQENIVDLGGIQGEANYVAFMSAFDTQNIFFLDDITIEYKTTLSAPIAISVNPRATSAEITWKGNATTYNIMITNEDVDPAKATATQIVDQANGLTAANFKTEALEADHSWNRPYFVYVQAVNGTETSAWSYRYPFVTIAAQKAVPYTFDFETGTGKTYSIGDVATQYPVEIGMFSNDPEYPHLVTTNVHAGSACLNLTKDFGNDSWITLPMIDSLAGKQVKFYLSGSSTPAQAHATLGVMTNPMDMATFIPVSDFTVAATGYTLCYANFENYSGPEGIIAIAWTDLENGKKTINYIDDVTVEELQKCLPPVNVQTEAFSDSVSVSWDKSDATTWDFVLANKTLSAKQLEEKIDSISKMTGVLFANTVQWTDLVNKPTFGFDSLTYNTSYYIYVRTLCGDDKTWWVEASFTTPCPDNFPIPFSENFESYSTGDYSDGFNCWQVANYGTGTGYPKILKPSSGAQDGNMLELWSTSTTQRNLAMLPGLDGDLSKMVLCFDARSYGVSTKSVVYVGSMADIRDWTTFVAIDTIYMDGGNVFTNVRMDLANYNLAYNNIVFTSGLGNTLEMNSDIYIDNVVIKPNTCIEAWDFKAIDIQTNSIDIAWEGKANNNEWKVKVMQDTVVVIADTIVSVKEFHAEGLKAVTEYTFYVQPSCDTIWTSVTYRTACVKLDPSKPNKETFENYPSGTSYNVSYQAPCWTVGNGNPSATTTYIPYIYKTTATYAASGTNCYRLYPTSTYSPTWVAAPEIDCNSLTELAVTFSYYGSSTYYILPGVMTDPEDLSTFVVLDSIKCEAKIVTKTMDLSDYAELIPANAKYFAWRTAYNAGPTIYLDDVSFVKITCPLPKPSYSGLTAEQVRISSGLRTDNEWILLVSDTAAFTADELALINVDSLAHAPANADHIIFYDTIDARNYLVKGLKEQTNYYVAIATVCEDGLSSWATTSFLTPCKAVTPEAMGTITFSKEEGYVSGTTATRYMPCWTVGNKSGNAGATSSYIPSVGTTASYKHNGNQYLYMYAYVPTSATSTAYDGAYAIMPELDVEDITKYQVNFWARTTSSTGSAYHDNLIVGVVTDPTDLNTFVVVDTLTLSHTAYEPFTVSLEDYEGDYLGNKGKYFMFLAECGTPTYCYAYISEISVEKIPACRPVAEFFVDSIAEDAAMISWKQYSDSYRMMVADMEVADTAKATYTWLQDVVVTKTDSVLITGLKPATQYYVYAQALCEGGDSSAISMAYASIMTNCPEITGYPVPYYNDFENSPKTGTGNKPLCWDGVYLTMDSVGSTQSYPYVNTTASYAASGTKTLYMYSYGSSTTNYKCYAVAPKIAGDLSDYMISFYARKTTLTATTYGTTLLVGYVTDATQRGMDSTFVTIAEVEVTTATQQPYQVIVSDYTNKIPAGARIALKADWSIQKGLTASTKYANFIIDNFKIGFPPSCFAPTLEAGKTTLNTAEIIITPAKEGNDKWQLAVVPDSVYSKEGYDAATYLAGKQVRIVDADSANFIVSGLDHSTLYWFYGRTVCGGDDGNSAWSDLAVSARTKYYYGDSYFFGFEKEEGWERGPLSTSDSYIIHPALEAGYVQLGSAITSYSYMPYAYITTSANYNYGYGPADGSMGITGLRWNATASYYGQYVIMPALNEAKARSFEFKLRNGYSYISSGKYIVTTSYDICIEVGTVDKFKGMETYQKLATIRRPALPSSTEATPENDWQWWSYTLDLDSATIADKQIVFFQAEKPTTSNYPYFDHVTMGAPKGFGLVSLGKIQAEGTKATVNWDNIGGPWNLYITKENGKKTDTIASYLNLSGVTSQVVTGLSPQSEYTAILVAANAPADTKYKVSATKTFKTPCLALDPNANGEFVWDFNDKSEWERSDVLVGGANANTTDTCYWKPGCFTVGTTYSGTQSTSTVYYNWLIQRKGYGYTGAPTGNPATSATSTARYEYGRGDSPALRVYTSSTYMTPYIVLPELNCGFDTMMIEFWGRCFANYADDYGTAASRNKMVSATYLGASYSKSLVIGTLTDPNDFSTLQVIDTVTYTAYTSTTTDLVTKDPTGNRYWQQFQLPLGNAKGKYIVLFQPAYGLFFLDDLKVKPVGDNLFAPSAAQTTEVTTTTATFTWDAKHPSIQTVVVVTNAEGTSEILRDTIAGSQMQYTATGLTPSTAYQWTVYQTNGTVDTQTPGYKQFYTECVAVAPDYNTSFELIEGWRLVPGATSDTYKQTLCWTYGNAGTTTSWTSSFPYNIANTASAFYGYEGAYAVKLYAYGTTMQNYIAMPEIEDVAAYDTLQVNFMMRPGVHNASGKISTTYAYYSSNDHYYAKTVIVGTMTDPADVATFVPIDTITYDGSFTTSDYATAANDYLFQKCKVALTGAKGKYVAIMASLNRKGEPDTKCTYDYMYIDNVSFSAIQYCETPEDLTTSEITATTAKLSWTAPEGAAEYILQVSTDPLFANDSAFVFNDTVKTTSQVLKGLESFTEYIWRIRTICGEDLGESEFSQNTGFTTARQPFFIENFGATDLTADWSFATNPAVLVFDSTDVELKGSNSTSYGWRRVTTNAGIEGAHYATVFYSSSSATTTDYDYYWMISPVISLNDSMTAHLTFDMALTGCSASTTPGATPAQEAQMADDYTFIVAISEDGGQTWSKNNILAIWNNTLESGSQLRDIPFAPANLRFDLAKYAGKNIRVAFYREADTYKGTSPYSCAIHLDNIRINYYDNIADAAQACQYEDVNKLDFYIDGDVAEAGKKTYKRLEKAYDFDANTKNYHDSIYTLEVEYFEAPETIMADTICEGETFTDVNFHGKSRSGVYRRKLQSVEHCDSIITLYLSVTPTLYADAVEKTICPGESFTWNGKDYNRAGLYIDTLLSSLGCDSIETLVLGYYADEDTLYDAIRISVDELPYTYQNAAHPYMPNQAAVVIPAGTKKGEYTYKPWVQGDNCAAVLVLTVEVYDPHEGIDEILSDDSNGAHKVLYNDNLYIISNGKWYNAEGKLVDDPREISR